MNTNLDEVINQWVDWLMVSKSTATVYGYDWDVRALVKAVPRDNPADYSLSDLTSYMADRRRAGISAPTLKRAVASFRSFFGFACRGAGVNVADGLPFPKIKRKRQRTLDEDQMLSVLAACDSSSEIGTRDLAILCLMVDSGLRSHEVCRLKAADIDLDKRRLYVVVKGGDEKSGAFSAVTAQYLRRWLDVRARRITPDVDTFFISIGGETPGRALTTSGLRVIFRKIGRRAGLPKGFSPHDLRRTFATLALRLGAPTRMVQEAGRWENIAMVEQYSRAITVADFEQYSPVVGLLGKARKDQGD